MSMRKISSGKRLGNNFFQSLEEFSIPSGTEVVFENELDIQNLFIRVTGNKISIIDGLIKAAGRANLFLINPNGITFGQNTSLNLNGCFIATTASSIEFADGSTFSANVDDSQVSLTATVPVRVNFNGKNGSITVNGIGNQIDNKSLLSAIEFEQRPTGLSVKDGNTLALVSNGINFNGGVVTTEGGNIDLTSVESGSVEITHSNDKLTLLDDAVNKYQDINLNQQSLIDSSGEKVGNISLIGTNVNIIDYSFVLAQNQGNLTAGSISIKALETLTLAGRSQASNQNLRSAIRSETLNAGEASNINILANELVIQDSARIRTYSFSEGWGGNININISNSSHLSKGSIIATTYSKGNAGNISLSTSQLSLSVAGISSSTFGDGNGGKIDINANLIEIIGSDSINRGSIAATSWASGNAGDVTINSSCLKIIEGASLSSSSFAHGQAGNISINASELIEVRGILETSQVGSNPQSTIRSAVQSVSPGARKAFKLPDVPTGNSGNLIINTPIFNITQGGVVTVENQGIGNAGNIKINTNSIDLNEAGSITAAAESGKSGDIFLTTQKLQISKDSQINAAGIENSGKIIIDTKNVTT